MGILDRVLERVILHLDMDAFYAAVEVREDPSLAGKPLIIGHPGGRGVVSTCSYEARAFGVHSAMPSVTAMRLCPNAEWRHGRMELYVEISRRIRAILADESPSIEPLSIDEAFIDLTGIAPDLNAGVETARRLQKRIAESERLTASVGIAPNKFLAKVASDMEKPNGRVLLSRADVPARLWPLPVRRLWGVGPKMAERLDGAGVHRIGDIVSMDPQQLESLVGEKLALHLRRISNGEDDRPVHADRVAKSISEERTYGTNLTDAGDIDRALLARAEGVARRLRRAHLYAKTVQIKVRRGDFKTWIRAATLDQPTDLAEPLWEQARELLRQVPLRGSGIRLLGLGTKSLVDSAGAQGNLFESAEEQRGRTIARITDTIRDRLGEDAVTRARLLRRKGDSRSASPEETSSLPSVD